MHILQGAVTALCWGFTLRIARVFYFDREKNECREIFWATKRNVCFSSRAPYKSSSSSYFRSVYIEHPGGNCSRDRGAEDPGWINTRYFLSLSHSLSLSITHTHSLFISLSFSFRQFLSRDACMLTLGAMKFIWHNRASFKRQNIDRKISFIRKENRKPDFRLSWNEVLLLTRCLSRLSQKSGAGAERKKIGFILGMGRLLIHHCSESTF